jgi:hypothetical protein
VGAKSVGERGGGLERDRGRGLDGFTGSKATESFDEVQGVEEDKKSSKW